MSIYSVDASEYQGNIDWKSVKASGVDYAILRILKKDGSVDKTFETNYANARSAGMKVGVYRFCYAGSIDQSVKEAVATVNTLNGRSLDLPIFYDVEGGALESISSAKAVTDIVLPFLQTVENNTDYKIGIYTSDDWYKRKLDVTRLLNYDFWIAKYGKDTGVLNESIKPSMDMSGWQFTSKAKVNGIAGNVDKSIFYKDYAVSSYHKVGWEKQPNGTYKFYLSPTKYVSNDWYKDGDKWYWFDQSGTMVTDVWYMYKTKWYYLGPDGAMVTDLQHINGQWYYFYKDGDMATNPVVFTPDENGALRFPGLIKGLI